MGEITISTQGFKDWLFENFLDDEDIGPALQQGHYDLIGPGDTDIQPTTWEQLVKPGMSITLSVLPMSPKAPHKTKQSSSAMKRKLSFFSG